MDLDLMREFIDVVSGKKPCDMVLVGGKVVDVFTCEVIEVPVSIHRGFVVAFEELEAREVFDLGGRYLSPGLSDAHIHIESTMLSPYEFSRAVLKRGTVAVFCDPHEISNSLGEAGLEYMFDASSRLPVDIYFLLPSCVPATPFETSGGEFTSSVLEKYRDHPRVVGLAEFMNVPGLIGGDEECLRKVSLFLDSVVDGHAPGVSGKDLSLYIMLGPDSDHETVEISNGLEKLRKGMFLYLREGTSEKNLRELLPLVVPERSEFFAFATDDRSPLDLLEEGHIDDILRKAVRWGLKPELAIKIASLNTFRRFRLKRKGAVAPGYHADMVVFDSLDEFGVYGVIKDGRWVYKDGDYLFSFGGEDLELPPPSFNIPDISRIRERLNVVSEGERALVIEIVPGQIITRKKVLNVKRGVPIELSGDVSLVAVVERHKGTGNIGVGLISGLGLESGAIATTVSHDSHNLVVAGRSMEDMLLAIETLKACGGGMVVVKDGEVLSVLPLPIGGLMSNAPFHEVAERYRSVKSSLKSLGKNVEDEAFMYLSFVALPVIPSLRVTDRGLFDVEKFSFVPLTF